MHNGAAVVARIGRGFVLCHVTYLSPTILPGGEQA